MIPSEESLMQVEIGMHTRSDELVTSMYWYSSAEQMDASWHTLSEVVVGGQSGIDLLCRYSRLHIDDHWLQLALLVDTTQRRMW
jgi:hypothetical protein